MKHRGVIKRVFPERGFAFIKRDDDEGDVFLHVKQFPAGVALEVGMVVDFEIGIDRDWRERAQNVTVIDFQKVSED